MRAVAPKMLLRFALIVASFLVIAQPALPQIIPSSLEVVDSTGVRIGTVMSSPFRSQLDVMATISGLPAIIRLSRNGILSLRAGSASVWFESTDCTGQSYIVPTLDGASPPDIPFDGFGVRALLGPRESPTLYNSNAGFQSAILRSRLNFDNVTCSPITFETGQAFPVTDTRVLSVIPPLRVQAASPAPSASPCSFDLDGNGKTDALTDGLILMRALFGLTGDAVTNNVLASDAKRKTWEDIRSFSNANCGTSFK